MTSHDGFYRELEDYLESFDGETPLPGRVRDAVDAELPWTRQVRPRLGLTRRTNMSSTTSTIARLGLLAACLVVAVALGSAILLPGRAPSGAAGSPSEAPTAVPTPTPQALLLASPASCRGTSPISASCVAPGTYLIGSAVPGGLIDVPMGWSAWEPGSGAVGLLVDRSDAMSGSGWGVVFMQIGDVLRDPCDPPAGTYPKAAVDTPEELAAVMAAWPGFGGTPPEPITIGGVSGVQTRLTWGEPGSTCGAGTIWRTPTGTSIDGYPMVDASRPTERYPADFRLLKIDGGLVAIRTMGSARTSPYERGQGVTDDLNRHKDDVVALEGILDSIRFEGAAQ